jgi:hypothetical protein
MFQSLTPVGGNLTRLNDVAGHFPQFDIEMLRRSAQHVKRLIGGDALALDENAFGLTNDLPGPECRDEVIDSEEPDIEKHGRIFPSLGGPGGNTGVSRENQRLGPVDRAVGTGRAAYRLSAPRVPLADSRHDKRLRIPRAAA